jgi:hypothetical protein
VSFYTTGPSYDPSKSAVIEQVILRSGVNGTASQSSPGNCDDSTGDFADLALMRLSVRNDSLGSQAPLAWKYPGSGVPGKKVGAGIHNGNQNPTGVLLQVSDDTADGNDNDGRFDTVDDDTNKADSGGPFYVNGRVLGVLWGQAWVPFDHFNIYTSIPHHLDWILTKIGYSWSGQTPQANTMFTGTIVQTFFGTERMCQYACEKLELNNTASCKAYWFDSVSCNLVSNVTGAVTLGGFRGARR